VSSPASSFKYAEETGVKSLKIKHNNVLGYFHRGLTAGNADRALTDGGRGEGALHPPPDHGGRHAVHDDRALPSWKRRIANAADRSASTIELKAFERPRRGGRRSEAEAIKAGGAGACASIDVVRRGLRLSRNRGAGLLPTDRRCIPRPVRHQVGGRHPVVEQALRRQSGRPPSSPTPAISRRRMARQERRDLAGHRPEHGR
jgi:DNA mismatch repair protein MutS